MISSYMEHHFLHAARAALLCLLILAAGAAPANAAVAPPVDHAGRWITDARGRVVIVHGVNMVYKRPPYAPDAIGFDDADAAFLAREGFNAVRLGVIWKAVEPQPGVYDDAYLDRIAKTVAVLRRRNILTQLDFHQDQLNERFYGEGFPDWAIQDDGLPNKPDFGFGPNYLLLASLERAFDHFWANDPGPDGVGLQDHYAAAWRHVAQRFRGDRGLLGYDLFNEPFPGTVWEPCVSLTGCPEFDAKLSAFNAKVIGAIRSVDPRGLAWYEPNVIFNNGPATHVVSGGDRHAGFSFHDYCLFEPQTRSNTGCDPFDDLVFANAEKHVAGTGDALMLTEFGATDDAGNNEAMVDRADRTRVSWMWWAYCGCDDPTTSGPGTAQALVLDPSRPPTGDNLQTAKLDTVVRPYPRLVSGTPRSWSFARDTKTFRAEYINARTGGAGAFAAWARSEFLVPARQYPDGYAAQVSGGAITSSPGATVLRVAACPGATTIRVTVTPHGARGQSCSLRRRSSKPSP
jgi:endoglycosylceramidase